MIRPGLLPFGAFCSHTSRAGPAATLARISSCHLVAGRGANERVSTEPAPCCCCCCRSRLGRSTDCQVASAAPDPRRALLHHLSITAARHARIASRQPSRPSKPRRRIRRPSSQTKKSISGPATVRSSLRQAPPANTPLPRPSSASGGPPLPRAQGHPVHANRRRCFLRLFLSDDARCPGPAHHRGARIRIGASPLFGRVWRLAQLGFLPRGRRPSREKKSGLFPSSSP